MNKFKRLYYKGLRVIFMVLSVILYIGCNPIKSENSSNFSIELTNTNFSSLATSVFLDIKSNGKWIIELLDNHGSQPSWASVSPNSGYGDSNPVLRLKPNNKKEARSCTIIDKNSNYRLTIVQGGSNDSSNNNETVGGNNENNENNSNDNNVNNTSLRWLELPQMNNSKLKFYTHRMRFRGKDVRNYSFYYDKDNKVSIWVAYPLIGAYTGKVKRTDAWSYDPKVPRSEQSNVSGGFKTSRGEYGVYDRGHQQPSADRTFSREANEQTFYSTNMTPQLGVLNQQSWADLEKRVRQWASNSDTLYVVTGCIIKGATKYALDVSRDRVTVPVGYFKALLRYTKNTTLGYKGYISAAFYYEQKQYPKGVERQQSMSVSDLEKMVGYKFFVNLDNIVGKDIAKRIKDENPKTMNWWWSGTRSSIEYKAKSVSSNKAKSTNPHSKKKSKKKRK